MSLQDHITQAHPLGMRLFFDGLAAFPSVKLGHAQVSEPASLSGTSVVIFQASTTAAVDSRGGGPATHETDILRPGTLGYGVDAIVLTGGSAYGLASARGVADVLASQQRGCVVGEHITVPIVPAASIFDVGRGGSVPDAHGSRGIPGVSTGSTATLDALSSASTAPSADHHITGRPVRGSVGAGLGAWTGRGLSRGGLGHARVVTPGGWSVAAMVVANPSGSVLSPTGQLYAHTLLQNYELNLEPLDPQAVATAMEQARARETARSTLNTTIALLVTDAPLSDSQCQRLASSAHAGLARAIYPSHTLLDGDTIFAAAVAQETKDDRTFDNSYRGHDLALLNVAAADAMSAACVDAVLSAHPYSDTAAPMEFSPPPMRELFPGLCQEWEKIQQHRHGDSSLVD